MADVVGIGSIIAATFSLLFAIITLGVVADKAVFKPGDGTLCFYEVKTGTLNTSTSICDFGIAMGVLGMLASIIYSGLAFLDHFKPMEVFNVKVALIIRAGAAGVFAFLWLVCFAVITDAYNKNNVSSNGSISSSRKSGMEAGIASSFLSVIAWAVIFVFSLLRVRSAGAGGKFSPEPKSEPTPQ